MTYEFVIDPATGLHSVECVRRVDGAIIPADSNNADWRAYEIWRADGNAPTPPPPVAVDWTVECDRRIAAAFEVAGVSVRASMSIWAASVALTPPADHNADDRVCAAMTPLLNAWEGAMFAERDRLADLAGATFADARWPALPEGAESFIAACAQA